MDNKTRMDHYEYATSEMQRKLDKESNQERFLRRWETSSWYRATIIGTAMSSILCFSTAYNLLRWVEKR
jgi:hypothetical protein